MKKVSLRRPSPATVLATVAVLGATAGSATAAKLITGADIKNGSVTGADVRNGSLQAGDMSKSLRRQLAKAAAAGAQGEKGERGAAGAQGAKGDSGGTILQQSQQPSKAPSIIATGGNDDVIPITGTDVTTATNVLDVLFPAGKWDTTAKIGADRTGDTRATCRMVAPSTQPEQETSDSPLLMDNPLALTWELQTTFTFDKPTVVELECWEPATTEAAPTVTTTGSGITAYRIGEEIDLPAAP